MKNFVVVSLFISGLIFCIGVVLIGVGSTFLASSSNSDYANPTCNAEEPESSVPAYNIELNTEDLRVKIILSFVWSNEYRYSDFFTEI